MPTFHDTSLPLCNAHQRLYTGVLNGSTENTVHKQFSMFTGMHKQNLDLCGPLVC